MDFGICSGTSPLYILREAINSLLSYFHYENFAPSSSWWNFWFSTATFGLVLPNANKHFLIGFSKL